MIRNRPLAGDRRVRLTGVVLALGVANAPAMAQSLDYSALEDLFHEPVTASATGQPQRVSDAPVNMEVITQEDIQRVGATSIPDVLQYVAGVDVRRYGIADAEVGIRGYNQPFNPRLLVMVNGRQVYSDEYGYVAWATIPVQLAEIRQIEIIKGPNSALYGFNAVSGVINIITYDPLRDRINTATVTGGTQGYYGGSAVGTARAGDDAGLRLSVGGFRSQDFFTPGPTPADGISRLAPQVGAFNADARARVTPDVEVLAEASLNDTRYTTKDFEASFDNTFVRTNSVRFGISDDSRIGLLNLNAYRNEKRVSVDMDWQSGTWVKEDVYVVQASDTLKLNAHHVIRVGVEYRNSANTSPAFFQGTVGYDNFAANAMWSWEITPDLSLTNAVRVDYLRLSYQGTVAPGTGFTLADYNDSRLVAPSFNSGLVFRATEKDTFRVMIGRGVQLPSVVDFGLQFPFGKVGPVIVAGSPSVQPSNVTNVELDYDRALPAVNSAMRVALFAQDNENLIATPFAATPVFNPFGQPVLLSGNIGHSKAGGSEVEIKGHAPSGFRWNASYAFVITGDGTPVNTGPTTMSPIDWAHSVPRHVLSLGLGYTWHKIQMDVMARWQSSYVDHRLDPNSLAMVPFEASNYVALNARVAYPLTEYLLLAVTGQQFALSVPRAGGTPIERRLLGSITAHF